MTTRESPSGVAVVVAGAGARGSYEAGVLSVVVPRLRAAGFDTPMFVGTSVGALNAAIFAGFAHLPPADQAQAVLDVWREISVSDVFASPVRGSVGVTARYLSQLAHVPGLRLTGVLDTAPLRRTTMRVLARSRLRENIAEGRTTLAVVATSGATNRSVVFVDRAGDEGLPPSDDDRPIDYVRAQIGPEHLLASSAIPVVFPAVYVASPSCSRGWYLDGGVRLNAPLKPAVALGAEAVVVVATHPVDDPGPPAHADGPRPDVDDTLVHLVDAALVDRMVEDVRTLAKVNTLVRARGGDPSDGDRYRLIPYLPVCPRERGTLGRLAAEAFGRPRSGALLRPREAELRALGWALGGDGPRRGDLLSYLYFDPDFIDAAIHRGRCDAVALFDGAAPNEIPWLGSSDKRPRVR